VEGGKRAEKSGENGERLDKRIENAFSEPRCQFDINSPFGLSLSVSLSLVYIIKWPD